MIPTPCTCPVISLEFARMHNIFVHSLPKDLPAYYYRLSCGVMASNNQGQVGWTPPKAPATPRLISGASPGSRGKLRSEYQASPFRRTRDNLSQIFPCCKQRYSKLTHFPLLYIPPRPVPL